MYISYNNPKNGKTEWREMPYSPTNKEEGQ